MQGPATPQQNARLPSSRTARTPAGHTPVPCTRAPPAPALGPHRRRGHRSRGGRRRERGASAAAPPAQPLPLLGAERVEVGGEGGERRVAEALDDLLRLAPSAGVEERLRGVPRLV